MSDHLTGLKLIKEVPSFFEKIAEIRFLYVFAAFIFALDDALVYFAHKNLLTLSTNSPEITIGNAIVFLGVFSFLIGSCFPILRKFIRGVIGMLAGSFLYRIIGYFESPTTYNPEFKLVSIVEHQALLERNEFDLKLVAQYRESKHESESEGEGNLDFIFAMTILFVCNLWVFGDQNVQTISQIFYSLLDQPIGEYQVLWTIYLVFLFLTFGGSLYGLWPFPSRVEKIYLPKPEDHAPKAPVAPEGSYARRLPPAIAPSKSQWASNENSDHTDRP